MAKNKVIIKGHTLGIPVELYQAMRHPKRIRISELSEPGKFVIVNLNRARYILVIKVLIKRLLRKESYDDIIVKIGVNEDHHFYRIKNARIQKNLINYQLFHITNYDPEYHCSPVKDDVEVSSSASETWSKIVDYGQHLEISSQNKAALRISKWLANDIFKPKNPSSILELGCGAGRNLALIEQAIPDINMFGVDINESAVRIAKNELSPKAQVSVKSVYHLECFKTNSIDIIFTYGLLMHIPHDKVGRLILEMHRISRKWVVHFELHGPSHGFDYFRYPRNYKKIYDELKVTTKTSYQIFPYWDFRNISLISFNHALLIYQIS
jgi:SAM-dependent methyltransferase